MKRRDFLLGACATGFAAAVSPARIQKESSAGLAFGFADVTAEAGLQFRHNSGAYGGKLLPETLGSGCAFLDYDNDGWLDILLVNGTDWPGPTATLAGNTMVPATPTVTFTVPLL